MTEEEFRADLLAAVASRAEVQACGLREAFVSEMLERLQEASEAPDIEPCAEIAVGHHGRKLEIDAWSEDEADGSLHLFIAMYVGGANFPTSITLKEAREHGFNRLLGIFEQAYDGWLISHIEESRPLWALARRIKQSRLPPALRLHVLTDRPISERLREIPSDRVGRMVVTYQIWDVTRLKRIHDARSVRDDLIVDFSHLTNGGLRVLPASIGSGDYEGFLAIIPGDVLAEIYMRHGSRLLEGNVRTFLGRSGKVNKGIAATIAKEPARFFAYNNGIAATASQVTTTTLRDGSMILTSATDLQIVNGAQTTASLATALRDKSLLAGIVFVPMKLSVVEPSESADFIPLVSRFANSQNSIRSSDFFANHAFHRRIEEISRRLLAPSVEGSLVQTYWYYERARGQYLNDQTTLTGAKRNQFLLQNPRRQVITKTELAKVECCFNLEPDIACKGAEKAFVAFAERISKEWEDEARRTIYGDEWFRAAVARVLLFNAAEFAVSNAPWYEGGYRAQIVAYTCARLSKLALDQDGGGLDYHKVWTLQSAGPVLTHQIERTSEIMARVLKKPPLAGQNISEWAKQQACRRTALETRVPLVRGFEEWVITGEEKRSKRREQKVAGQFDRELDALQQILAHEAAYWRSLRGFCRTKRILLPEDEKALVPACQIPGMLPTDKQAARLLKLVDRAVAAGWQSN